MCSKVEITDQKGVYIRKLNLFLEFPTIPIICLINIDKYYKICTFLKKSCINFQNFPENVINDLYRVCFPCAPNSAKFRGGCRGPVKIRQWGGGGCNIFFYFLRVKNITF